MYCIKKVKYFLVVLVSTGGVASVANASASRNVGYSVKGVLSETVYASNISQIRHKGQCPFELNVFGTTWSLTLNPTNGAVHNYAFDGVNIVELFQDPSPKASKLPMPAILCQGDLLNSTYFANYVWLAYCSSHFLDEGKTLPVPWLDPSKDPRAFTYSVSVERFSEEPRLPSSVKYVGSIKLAQAALHNPILTFEGLTEEEVKQRNLLAAQVQDGRQAEYQVLSTTNLSGLVVPTRFLFRIHRKFGVELGKNPPNQKTDENALLSSLRTNVIGTEIVGVAESVNVSLTKPDWPNIEGKVVSVVDRRFQSRTKGVDHITYNVTNYWLKSMDNSRLKQVFEAKKLRTHPVQTRASRSTILAVFGFLAVLPAIVWWLVRRRTSGNKETLRK